MRILTASLFFFHFLSHSVHAQVWQWAKTTNAGTVTGSRTVTDAAGNIYATGAFENNTNFGCGLMVSFGAGDFFIVKYDPSGTALWSKRAGASSYERGWDIAVDPSGNVLVTGTFQSSTITFGSFTLTNSSTGYADVFVVKYDPSGNVLWAVSGGGSGGTDESRAIAVDNSGNAYITGQFTFPSITFGSNTINGFGLFIVKYDPSGNVVWTKGNIDASGYAAEFDPAGYLYIAGNFTNPQMTIETIVLNNLGSNGSADIFLAKFDLLGNVVWAVNDGGTLSDLGRDIALDPRGNILLTGFFYSPSISFASDLLINATTSGTRSDMLLLKYDSLGNRLWGRSAGDSENDHGQGVCVTTDGEIFVTGAYSSLSITFGSITLFNAETSTFHEAFIAEFDSTGIVPFAYSMAGNPGSDYGEGVATDAQGNVFVVGFYCTDTLWFGNLWIRNPSYPGYCNFFIAKLEPDITVNTEEFSMKGELFITPNPSSGLFNCRFSGNTGSIEVLDVFGKKIAVANLTRTNDLSLDLTEYPPGIYCIRVFSNNGAFTRKVIITD